jgi:hypothetical protein
MPYIADSENQGNHKGCWMFSSKQSFALTPIILAIVEAVNGSWSKPSFALPKKTLAMV